jgi:hypothetical protein
MAPGRRAPPVTIAVRPASRAINSSGPWRRNFRSIELLLDDVLGRLIGELERLRRTFAAETKISGNEGAPIEVSDWRK